jgi:hypothetical protein
MASTAETDTPPRLKAYAKRFNAKGGLVFSERQQRQRRIDSA